MRTMRKTPRASSGRTGILVCPFCEMDDVETRNPDPRCSSCDRAVGSVLPTLREILSLPDARGCHACECGHPEMRLLPDGIYRCPACCAEVLPFIGGQTSIETGERAA